MKKLMVFPPKLWRGYTDFIEKFLSLITSWLISTKQITIQFFFCFSRLVERMEGGSHLILISGNGG